MQIESSLKAPNSYVHDGHAKCPLCQWTLIRQRRRPVDRLWSLIHPVKRYRCENFSCQWLGNIAATRTEATATDTVTNAHFDDYTEERLPRRVPVTFVVHMVLVAVGVVFVFVYSSMEPTLRIEDNDAASNPNVLEWAAQRFVNRADAR